MLREIVLDTETTGLDPVSGDRVVEIGCVELINHFPSGETWHEYLNPERDMPAEAEAVHGLSRQFLADKPVFSDRVDGFTEFIGDATLIIHNAPFDVKFLNFELDLAGKPALDRSRIIDTLQLARRKFPGAQNSLDALCRRFRVDNSARSRHGALLDSELLAEVYAELIGCHQARLDLGTNQAGSEHAAHNNYSVPPRPAVLAPRITQEELAAHRNFVETLVKDASWRKYLD